MISADPGLSTSVAVALFTLMHCWGLRTGETRLLRPEHVHPRDHNLDVVSAKGTAPAVSR